MIPTALFLALALSPLAPGASQGGGPPSSPLTPACSLAIEDLANPGNCIGVSSVPLPGSLLPIGPYLFVAPTGEVGIGNQSPGAMLDISGNLRADGRFAIGNEAEFGPSGSWDWMMEASCREDSFASSVLWTGMRSDAVIVPTQDMSDKWLWGHMFHSIIEGNQPYDVLASQGVYLGAQKHGSGTTTYLGAAGAVTETNEGHTEYQSAMVAISLGDNTGTIAVNAALEVRSGHWGAGGLGLVEDDYGIYVLEPSHDSPITNHYGLFLEDQVFAQQSNYAIYSEGGDSYHEGSLGLGTTNPSVKLDVVGDFAATGTKSFVQAHPDDPTKEIWFVCLEGNEAGTYFRGSARLEGGRASIPVPEDFRGVTAAEGLTVQLTAVGGPSSMWVESQDLERIVVRGDRDVDFAYMVNGVRRGYADFSTLRDKPELTTHEPRRPQLGRQAMLHAQGERD